MHPDGNLIVYKNKGRPNATEKEMMKSPSALKIELDRLKMEMGYEEGTEIDLSISIASDQMIRHVYMFPEIFSWTLPQTPIAKREIYLLW